ncbi:MAG TPA: hypothetical protein VIF15_04545 [Polyangiaceae bacterium]
MRILWALPAVLSAVLACSGTTTGGGGGVSDAQACSDLAANICNQVASCAPFLVTVIYGDATTCASRFDATCPDTLAASGTGATASNVEACAQAYKAASCDDILSNNTPSACQIHGSLAAGQACGDDTQCAGDGGFCNVASGQACGVCGTRAAAGAACAANKACQVGLVCALPTGATTGSCVAPGAQGATCDAGHPCKSLLTCFKGTCAQPMEAGQACDGVAQNCDYAKGLFCNPQTKVCATITTATGGGTCGYANGTYSVCTGGATCQMGTGGTGTCQAAAADGATCGSNGASCEQPATCVNNACALPNASACK